ncbi:MAG: hypothetical protein UE295_12510 [Acutalibacteraceae bacterium]|nr:hypothetical protein [Acutalibacteraceae bacterium]
MKKLVCLITVFCLLSVSLIFSGCAGDNALDKKYKTPDMNFKGLKLECVSGGDTFNMVRNNMVYKDLEKFIIDDQDEKGNKIKSIKVSESSGDVYNEDQTVAVFNVDLEAESGDIKSGQYYISAYFTYDMKKASDVKMYLINYCFVDDYVIDQNTKNLYNDCYEKIKDQI